MLNDNPRGWALTLGSMNKWKCVIVPMTQIDKTQSLLDTSPFVDFPIWPSSIRMHYLLHGLAKLHQNWCFPKMPLFSLLSHNNIPSLFQKLIVTFFRCLLTHFVKVFFCMASRSSEEEGISSMRKHLLTSTYVTAMATQIKKSQVLTMDGRCPLQHWKSLSAFS